jgi:sodium transport system ATP-binding protein
MICGVLQPEAGGIQVDELPADAGPLARQQRTGALLDHIGLYPRLTVRENLLYYGRLRGLAPTALAKRVEEVIFTLALEAIVDRRTAGFSQGERMKTALGRALLHSPRNLLLDEPTNGLDIPTVRSLRDLLKRLRSAGVCILFSSHVIEEVRALCDRVVILSGGSVAASGSPAELCSRTNAASLEDAYVRLTC